MFLGLVPHGQPNGFGFRIGQANERPIGDSYGFTELLIYGVTVFSGSSVAESRYSRVYGDQSLRVTQSRVYAEKRFTDHREHTSYREFVFVFVFVSSPIVHHHLSTRISENPHEQLVNSGIVGNPEVSLGESFTVSTFEPHYRTTPYRCENLLTKPTRA